MRHAVVYWCVVCIDGDVQVTLITSKTKVAPIKNLTISQLELCGALLLAQQLDHIRSAFDFCSDQIDS